MGMVNIGLSALLAAARIAAASDDYARADELAREYASLEREYSERLGAEMLSESTPDARETSGCGESIASQPGGVTSLRSAPRTNATGRVLPPSDLTRGERVYFRLVSAGVIPRHQRCDHIPLAPPAEAGPYFCEVLS